MTRDQLAMAAPEAILGAVLLAPLKLPGGLLAKGTRLHRPLVEQLRASAAAGEISGPLRLAWPEPGDLHEDEAATRLARAVAGPGLCVGRPKQSRIDLTAARDGVLRVKVEALARLNRMDPLEVFTLFHGQAVRAGRTVAGVKVAPHIVAESAVAAGEAVARDAAPLIDVDPYLPLAVGALAVEMLSEQALDRFDQSARSKISSLGGRFRGTTLVSEADPAAAEARLRTILHRVASDERLALVLVGGVSAGDPLAPFYPALAGLGGRLLRRGVPAHPGSMIWLAALGGTRFLGLPQCGMFSMATAADLVLPRLLTGEDITADSLADLGHGGFLGPEMRFRFPDYAMDLPSPE